MMEKDIFNSKAIKEILRFNSNFANAPNLVPAPDEINLEMTPYEVVYKQDKVRLLHYKSPDENTEQKDKVRIPLVIAYALINRYHILDISPNKSWIRNLLDQGFDIYLIDWGVPTSLERYLDMDDYVNSYIDSCIDFVRKENGVDKVFLQGYCTGATLATIYAALHPQKIQGFVATAPVIDGKKDTTVVSNITSHIDVDEMVDMIGNVPSEVMHFCFSLLKPFEQGLEKYLNFFKNIDNKNYVDNFLRIEKWLLDTPPIPGELFKQWIKYVYQENKLIQNQVYIRGRHVDLKNITMPVFTQVAVGDHLVSPECSMPLHYAVGAEDKSLKIYSSGHVGMIASGFSQKKVLPELGQWLKERVDI